MSGRYILDGKSPVPCDDLIEWARWFETAERHVAETQVGPVLVSTVFLGINHSFGRGPPLLFETMIFGMDDNDYQVRCSTWDEAENDHQVAVAIARQHLARIAE